ncbi:MAG: 8-amino-7-oxononanoate synthase [Myxococcales bacterium]|nr:MAG: 8-amino-7-oxononanoate synthase [Myxococcales bacterium]
MSLDDFLEHTLQILDRASLRRKLRTLSGPLAPTILVDGKEVLCLCSNNYLGLASHPRLSQALKEGVELYGAGSGASRLVSGNFELHDMLEHTLADFVGLESSLVFSSGFAANSGIISAIYSSKDVIFSDELNHASIIDGCRLSGAKIYKYQHKNINDINGLLESHRSEGKKALIVSDAVFSMDGDLAPVSELHELARRYDAALMIDEAHALGVIGPQGRGLCKKEGIRPEILVGTFGKSFGLSGAFVAGDKKLKEFLINRARSFIYSTAIPQFAAHALLQATELVMQADTLRDELSKRCVQLREGLSKLGLDVKAGSTPIIPILIGSSAKTMALSEALLEKGVFVQGIRPPTVPAGTARLRLVPMATHSEAEIERALSIFSQIL